MKRFSLISTLLLSACAGLNYTPPVIPAGVPTATVSYFAQADEDMQVTINSTCQPRSFYGHHDVYSMGHDSNAVPDSGNQHRVLVEANKPFVASGFKKVLVGYETRWEWHHGFLMPEQYPIYHTATILPRTFTPQANHNYVVGLKLVNLLNADIVVQDLGTTSSPHQEPITQNNLAVASLCPSK